MTIKTLTFIHDLLTEETEKRRLANKWISEIYQKAVDEDAPNVQTLEEQKETAWNKYFEASRALDEFEQKEW